MLLAWQFILVWDIATLTFFLKNHKKYDLLASGLTEFFEKDVQNQKRKLVTFSVRSSRNHFGPFSRCSFCYTGFTESYVLPSLGDREGVSWRLDPSKFEREKEYLY